MHVREDIEIWKSVPGYEEYYEASNRGNIRSLNRIVDGRPGFTAIKKGKLLKPALSKKGYLRVLLCGNGTQRNISVHRLVAMAFIDNPWGLDQVNHVNGIKTDNRLSNIEWCTQGYNNRHARSEGLNVAKSGEKSHSYGLNNKQSLRLIHKLTREVKPIVEVAKEYPQYTRRHITMMVKGQRGNKTDYSLAS